MNLFYASTVEPDFGPMYDNDRSFPEYNQNTLIAALNTREAEARAILVYWILCA